MDIEKTVLSRNSFGSFNPVQLKALKKNWKKKNLVVSSPTASGKTLIAEVLSLHSVFEERKKVVYTCPLRALASEHFEDFKKKYSSLSLKATISTGDFDSSSKYLQKYDIVFTTFEKLNSLLRHKSEFLSHVGLLVADEIHEIDSDRGPCLEMDLVEMQEVNPKVKILALSATIPNATQIAKWLNADLVESTFRPVKLKEGVFFGNSIHFSKEKKKVSEYIDAVNSIVKDSLEEKQKQVLIFANTRKRAESIALQLSSLTEKGLSSSERSFLKSKALESLSVLESPTEQCIKLSSLLEKGIAFHHAGLLSKQRKIVEDCFRSNHLKALSSTPTLSMGLNLPAFRVVISSLYRFGKFGSERIKVREYKQLAGRAGRPKFHDEFGESIVIARHESEVDELFSSYIEGEVEEVYSNLSLEPVLRTHLLACISSNYVFDLESLEKFFSKTFYSFQYSDLKGFFAKLMSLISELEEMGFVECSSKSIKATVLGRRVSELYLDPLSAFRIVEALRQKPKNELYYLFLLAQCSEFYPLVSVPRIKQAEFFELLQEKKAFLPVNVDKEMFEDIDLLKKFATSLMLEEWVNESREQEILSSYNILPGILRSKLEKADWLLYGFFELSRLLQLEDHYTPVSKLRKRVKHGIREELISLCELKGIGRVRARRLFSHNFKTIHSLKNSSVESLSEVLGPKIAVQLKKQLGEKIPNSKALDLEKTTSGQKDLKNF